MIKTCTLARLDPVLGYPIVSVVVKFYRNLLRFSLNSSNGTIRVGGLAF